MHETEIQRQIRLSISPLAEQVDLLERKLKRVELMAGVTADICLRDTEAPSMLYAFVAKLNEILEHTK